jgi:single-stranded-DNA-specific exonuclease
MLMSAEHPRALAEDETAGAGRLREYRAEVNAALAEARRARRCSRRRQSVGAGPHAVGLSDPPLIAQQWRGRLPKHAVMGANPLYVPDVVAFSCRTSRPDFDLPGAARAAPSTSARGTRISGTATTRRWRPPPAPEFGRTARRARLRCPRAAAAGASEWTTPR